MNHENRVAVRARERAVVAGAKQSFQSEIVPNAVLEGAARTDGTDFKVRCCLLDVRVMV